MKTKLKKIAILSFIVAEVFLISAQSVMAARIPSASSIAAQLERRYHVSLSSMQDAGENFNVSADKNIAPQVMINFEPTEPKEGQKITAHAIPMYFSNTSEELYYTWYIKRRGEDKSANQWKIDAMRLIAQGGPGADTDYSNNTNRGNDNDGYGANLGGDDKTDGSKYCYIHDFTSGTNYEIGKSTGSSTSYDVECPDGTQAFCIESQEDVDSSFNSSLLCADTEVSPECTSSGTVGCPVGTPVCIDTDVVNDSNYYNDRTFHYLDGNGLYEHAKCFDIDDPEGNADNDDCFDDAGGDVADDWEDAISGELLSGTGCLAHAEGYTLTDPSCVASQDGSSDTCDHLFPHTGGHGSVGDDSFGEDEEDFWGTDPHDPNTAGNGNLDEANVAGLGQADFSWTYHEGDKVGVLVEGTAITSTKYDDSSYMTMWALPKNKFHIENTGSKVVSIKGYNVTIPTADNTIDEKETLEDNLVDPAERTNEKLDVSLNATPDNPINDSSGDNMGDVLSINSVVSNSSENSPQLHYEWQISAGRNASGSFTRISDRLETDGFIKEKLTGINNSIINIKLNLGDRYISRYFSDGIGYLKIDVTVKEAISGGNRVGKGEVIVKINSTDERMRAYLTTSSDGVTLNRGNLICNSTVTEEDKLSYYICPVIKNQILRLEADGNDMTDFSWTVNGSTYNCDNSVSSDCSRGNVMFLPIMGDVGGNIVVKLTAKKITSDGNGDDNGKSIELTKSFEIVEPYIKIISGDENALWSEALGSYTNLDGEQYVDFNDAVFETYNGSNAVLNAEFHPSWLREIGNTSTSWTLDDEDVTDSNNPSEITFAIEKEANNSYLVELSSPYYFSNEIRKVLKRYWGVSQDESDGEMLSDSVKINVIESDDVSGTTALKKTNRFLANIVSNLPGQTIFLIRLALVVFVIIVMSGLAVNLPPDFYKKRK